MRFGLLFHVFIADHLRIASFFHVGEVDKRQGLL
jgi:hypothetical protein